MVSPTPALASGGHDPADQHWPWWPLLPLYPYGRRPTLVRELLPDQLWSFEQLHGVWYVAVPIRMTVLRVREGLVLYAPVAPTGEVLAALREMERIHGPVCTIVLPTASGLEHKLPVPAMARAFPAAEVWVTPHQWSFPLRLPSRWLGFPAGRTRVLLEDGVPHADQLDWLPLGPLDLGLGTFMEVACFHRASGSLLVTDALVAISPEPPEVFDLDPTPLLFHARERGEEPLTDSPENRRRGWKRIVLFASYLRPERLSIASLTESLRGSLALGCRNRRSHFGFYPFRWQEGWEQEADKLFNAGEVSLQVAPVLERLVFPRARQQIVAWIRLLAALGDVRWHVSAHYTAPMAISSDVLLQVAAALEVAEWAPDKGSWATLSGIDQALVKFRLVPPA
jgi:hypothetical protein